MTKLQNIVKFNHKILWRNWFFLNHLLRLCVWLCSKRAYLSISISFSSSCFCRAMTPSMMARSSLVRWLRSGRPWAMIGPCSSWVVAIVRKWKTEDILAGVQLTHVSNSTHSSGWTATSKCDPTQMTSLDQMTNTSYAPLHACRRFSLTFFVARQCFGSGHLGHWKERVRVLSECLAESSSTHAPIHVPWLSERASWISYGNNTSVARPIGRRLRGFDVRNGPFVRERGERGEMRVWNAARVRASPTGRRWAERIR